MACFKDELRGTDHENRARVRFDAPLDVEPSVVDPSKEVELAHFARKVCDVGERGGPLQVRPGPVEVDGDEKQEIASEGDLDGAAAIGPESCDWRQLFLQVGVNYSCRWPPGFIVVSVG